MSRPQKYRIITFLIFYFVLTSSVILAFHKQRKKSFECYYHTSFGFANTFWLVLCVCLSALLTIVQFITVFRSSFIKICLECHGNLSILSMHNLSLVVQEVVQRLFKPDFSYIWGELSVSSAVLAKKAWFPS